MGYSKNRSCEERIDKELKDRINEFRGVIELGEDLLDYLNNNALSYEDDPHYRVGLRMGLYFLKTEPLNIIFRTGLMGQLGN